MAIITIEKIIKALGSKALTTDRLAARFGTSHGTMTQILLAHRAVLNYSYAKEGRRWFVRQPTTTFGSALKPHRPPSATAA